MIFREQDISVLIFFFFFQVWFIDQKDCYFAYSNVNCRLRQVGIWYQVQEEVSGYQVSRRVPVGVASRTMRELRIFCLLVIRWLVDEDPQREGSQEAGAPGRCKEAQGKKIPNDYQQEWRTARITRTTRKT